MHDHGLAYDLATLAQRQADRRRALRWLSAGSVAPLGLIGASSAVLAATSDIDTVLNYAESAYGQWFPGPQTNRTDSTYTYRYYPSTGNYVGVSNARVYVLGPLFGTSPVDVGAVSAYVALANGLSGSGTCSMIPEETAGPYPGDGSNTSNGQVANALALSGIVRSDIRSSVGGVTGTAQGIPLTLQLQLVNVNGSCASLAGYAVYLWHCTREGGYSMYSSGITGQNYLRGVQASDANGVVQFTTIFPGCYDGRMPHMHFEVFRSLSSATSASGKIKTSQIAFPTATCQQVYADSGYSSSRTNLGRISFATDNVFSDGTSLQMASVSGDNTSGYTATLRVGVGG